MKKPIGKLLAALAAALCLLSVPAFAADDVAINEDNFPDANFRSYVSKNIDTDGNGSLSADEIAEVYDIDVESMNIQSLKGIEYFENVKWLDCSDNQLTSLDVSKNAALEHLDCCLNQLTELDVSNHARLNSLNCVDNQLIALNVSNNAEMAYLYCRGNQLTSLDLSGTAVSYLGSLFNHTIALGEGNTFDLSTLPNFDVSKASNWVGGTVDGNTLTVTENFVYYDYDCGNFTVQFILVDDRISVAVNEDNFPDSNFRSYVSENFDKDGDGKLSTEEITEVNFVAVDRMSIQSLKGIEYFGVLTHLLCSNNQLTELDVSKNAALVLMDCRHNPLTSLNLSNNPALEFFCTDHYCSVCEENIEKYGKDWFKHYFNYTIEIGGARTFDLSTLPGFDVTKASNWVGGTVNGTVLTVDADAETVSYDYDCSYNFNQNYSSWTMVFDTQAIHVNLNVTVKPDPDPEPEKTEFSDVPSDAYYAPAVDWAVANNVVYGTSATTFAPNEKCTRAQVVAFLWRAAGRPEHSSAENPFTDVNSDDYFYDAVLWAVENNIVYGTSATTFEPHSPCTRAQVAAFLYRAKGRPEPETDDNPFRDVSADAYYYDAVLWAVGKGVVYGTSDTTFEPNATCTRAQGVAFLYRAYGK